MRTGACNKYVALAQGPQAASGPFAALSPANVWASIEPSAPGDSITDRTITHLVRMRFHAQVSLQTRIAYVDARQSGSPTRYLYVRGFQAVNEAGDELRLLCEEVAS